MTSIATAYKHIHLDDLQIPIVAGNTMKVVELLIAQKAYGWSPEEIHFASAEELQNTVRYLPL
jgi:hypothetical protein